MHRIIAATLFSLLASTAYGQAINAGDRTALPPAPLAATAVASFDRPWAIAFLPDGRLLVTEKPGQIQLVTQDGQKTAIENVPAVVSNSQNGLLDIAPAPDFASSGHIYFTYTEPADGGSSLVLARARLAADGAALEDVQPIWRQNYAGDGGQPGGIIAFAPDGAHLFLTVGDRMNTALPQDPAIIAGKVIRLNLDGTIPDDNPVAENGAPGAIWTTGHRNPYGLAFDADGRLWEHEMGPRGGDELNLIERGQNYGWPLVSNGDTYSGSAIPRHDTRPEFAPPAVYWTPVIAPAGLAFYDGELFPDWSGSAFIGGLASRALVRVDFGEDGAADEVDRWDMGARIRDVAIGPDGALWVIEDGSNGRLLKLTPADGR